MRPQPAFGAPSALAGGGEPDALQRLVRRTDAMGMAGVCDLERHGLYWHGSYCRWSARRSSTRRVVDRYISSVMKVKYQTNDAWHDRVLTIACTEHGTPVYKKFSRAPACASDVLPAQADAA